MCCAEVSDKGFPDGVAVYRNYQCLAHGTDFFPGAANDVGSQDKGEGGNRVYGCLHLGRKCTQRAERESEQNCSLRERTCR